MGRELCFSLDLGSDTMKVACAFRGPDGTEKVVKVTDPAYSETAVPAVAFYDDSSDDWLFGYEVGRSGEKTFSTVVKIKDLLNTAVINRDYYTGSHGFPVFEFPITNEVPVKYYTQYGSISTDTAEFDQFFFLARTDTPRTVCRRFFVYVLRIMERFVRSLFHEELCDTNARYTLIFPPKSSAAYTDELLNLFSYAAHMDGISVGDNVSIQSSAKVLGMLAAYLDGLGKRDTESALLFDIGEERISVVKFTKMTRRGVSSFSVDGISGHSEPMKLGGNDIDKALVEEIERGMRGVEAFGSETAGKTGHIHETGLRANNYLFMKSVKAAKVILGREYNKGKSTDYPDGVPVSIMRDVEIFTNITQEGFARSIGLDPSKMICRRDSVLYRIVNYIINEIVTYKGSDASVKKIYLTGGAAGTAGLEKMVQYAVGRTDDSKTVKTFAGFFRSDADSSGNAGNGRPHRGRPRKGSSPDGNSPDASSPDGSSPDDSTCNDGAHGDSVYSIKDTDIFSYGPAVGAAMVSLRKDRIVVRLTKSYGLLANLTLKPETGEINNGLNRRFYSIIANMGSSLDFENKERPRPGQPGQFVTGPDGKEYKEFVQTYTLGNKESDWIYIYSSNITDSLVFTEDSDVRQDIQKLYRAGYGEVPVTYFCREKYGVNIRLRAIDAKGALPRGEKYYLSTPPEKNRDPSIMPIRPDVLETFRDELGFAAEGGGNGERTCLWYKNKSNIITSLTMNDRLHPTDPRYYVDVGVRIDRDGMATTFARMNVEDSRYVTFNITYKDAAGRTRSAVGVTAGDIIADFNKSITVDTGETAR